MDDAIGAILLRGGPVALVLALGLALKYAFEGLKGWRAGTRAERSAPSGVVADAATTNAMLIDSLHAERVENARKERRIDDLEAELTSVRTQLYEQQREYEAEIGQLRSKIQEITLQLEALQERIQRPQPRHH